MHALAARGQAPLPMRRLLLLSAHRVGSRLATCGPASIEQHHPARRAVACHAAPAATAAERKAPATPAPSATHVPRNPAVKDGEWTRVDAELVEAALRDADALGGSGAPAAAAPKQQQQPQQQAAPPTPAPPPTPLLGQSEEQLRALVASLGQPAFRAAQVRDALLQGARSLDDMTTLPRGLRAALAAAGATTGRSALHHEVVAPDGTRKLLLQLAEGRVVEAVGIPKDADHGGRLTVCVSSQVGCPMRCTFCATGKGGFARSLAAHEIVDQVLWVRERFGGKRVSNVVFMGMGEPCLNLPAVISAYRVLNEGLGIGGRSITVSTVGVPNSLARLAREGLSATLALSLHAPNQELREQLIPSAKAYPLRALMSDVADYFKTTGRRVTFEYTLMEGVNDEPDHAKELAELLSKHRLRSHVNLIPWNPVFGSKFKRPKRERVDAFKAALEAAGLPVSVRSSRGLEAAAACGQLRNKFQKEALAAPQALT